MIGTTGSLDTVGRFYHGQGSFWEGFEYRADDDSGNGYNFNMRVDLRPGIYYVRVESYGSSTGTYTLELTAKGQDGGGVDDHGDARSSATRVSLPSETAGRIDPGRDVDYFRFEVPVTHEVITSHTVTGLANGTRYYFRLRATNAHGEGPAAQTTIQLAASPNATVTISDAALRKAVEASLRKSPGAPITQLEMARRSGFSVNGVADLAGLEYAANLVSLSLRRGTISDITALGALRSLRYLYLDDNSISDVTALGALTSLEVLDLGQNGISDISPLAGLMSLTELSLKENSIVGLSPLAGLTSLTELSLRANSIVDVSPLAGLTSLTRLNLSDNSIVEVSPLSGLTSLTYLSLWGNAIVDVTPLAGLTSLTDLYLSGNAIVDVSLAGLTSLTTLDLKSNAIVGVSLAGLTSLTTLDLRYQSIVDVSLEGLTSLTYLDLSNNAVAGLSPMAGLTSLTYLDLSNNAVADLSPLAGLTSLTRLGLISNLIADVSPLAGLTSLTTLELGSNLIADASPLAGLTSLTTLDLDNNAVADLSPLTDLISLTGLYLGGNAISNVAPLVENAGLDVGDFVNLTGNFLDLRARETHVPTLLQRGVDVRVTEFAELAGVSDVELRQVGQWAVFLSGDFASLTSLDVSGRGVEDLTGLEAAAGLRGLFLDRNKIVDISTLAKLGSLRVLTLSHNRVEDLSPLVGMYSLSFLALDGNALCELPALPSNLDSLYLSDNCLSDVGTLASVWLRWELDVSGNSITSLAPLAGKRLRYLHFNDNEVAHISPLNFQFLRELHMRNNAVGDISPLLDGEELLMVDVRRNPLADDALTVLETLRARRVTVLVGETVPYFPAAGDGRQGFVRVVNRSDEAGHVFIEAVDDAGVRAGPARMEVGARQAIHFNSEDLEYGNAEKGLDGLGAPTADDWRLSVISPLDVEVLSYIRTEDGFVTAMHDVAADAMVPFFNPGSNGRQRSILRVVNTEAEPGKWTTGGYDDIGAWRRMADSLAVRPQHALMLTAQALEDDHSLGDGHGKWRLRVRGFPWYAMSLLESPTGHLTNLSTAPDNATELADGHTLHRLPLFPAAGGARQGFARVINRSYSPGEVTIEAVDDSGARSQPVRLTIRPRRVVHFNSKDLETGNAAKGLDGGVGMGQGDWRLEVTSELDLMVLSYARTADGFLTSLHDLAPVADDGSHRVVFFNPGSNRRQVSKLRLINDGERSARVSITGIDDGGSDSGTVTLAVPAGSALTFTSAELEAGDDDRLTGGLGDGDGKWRLRVRSDEPIAVMSLLETPTGHLTNVSTGTAD